ncbi:acyltransferase [Rhodomicrobium udaipurense JA643]|uniref:diacylglycerol O-acyltransferase n=1 Tax=Rhodomicrobium udaipurense TaxID=1202716 RepID=A0A8I1KGI1_9HYPH|nr:wax ester/triacylglycerol synthase family O-acyltransferase [Rhodomicrobium udaipurense]KAI94371.1 acyltransferase [Rhodomicrobium udaipurense JA643]MBJ7542770.1 wax ester/triacylglycerol synthase family O-acyltransferase [Rhodomicrobium udaipurense]
MSKAERVSAVDTTWLRMDRPSNPMVIVGVLILEGPLNLNTLEDTVGERFLAIPRFRQHVETRSGDYWWVDDPWFDRARHIQRVRLPGKAGQAELQRYIAGLASEPLDKSRPLWQIRLVEDYEGGAALVLRIHHAIGDGMALVGVMLSITDGGDRSVWTATRERQSGFRIPLPGLGLLKRGLGTGVDLWKEAAALAQNPTQAARLGAGVAGELAWLLTMPEDSPTRFKGKASGNKRVAWTDPIPLPEVKAVSHALGCTLNDMLLASVAGALGEYLKAKGDDTHGVEIRAFIPVDMRQSHEAGQLGNRFGLVGVELPAGIENPLARLAEVQRRMQALKQSLEPPVTLGLLEVIGHAPQMVQDRLFNMLMKRATAVMTNVPGPKESLYLGGARVSQIMFWVPQSGDIGMGVSILSFNDMVQFGLITDAAMVPDPEAIIAEFRPKFEQLLYYALMGAWGDADERAARVAVEAAIATEASKSEARRAKPRAAAKAQAAPLAPEGEVTPPAARSRKTPKTAASPTVTPVPKADEDQGANPPTGIASAKTPRVAAGRRKRAEAHAATEMALAAEATGAAPRARRSPRAFKPDLSATPEATPIAAAPRGRAKPRADIEDSLSRSADRERAKPHSGIDDTSEAPGRAPARKSTKAVSREADTGSREDRVANSAVDERRKAAGQKAAAAAATPPLVAAPTPRKPRQPARIRSGGETVASPAPKATARRKLPRG